MSGFSDIITSLTSLIRQTYPGELDNATSRTLSTLNEDARELDDETGTALENQAKVKEILNEEHERIQTNIQTIDDNMFTKKRVVEFNENQRLRTEQYNQILSTFIVAFSLILGIIIVFRQISFLPDYIAQGLIIIIGSITFIRIFNLYSNMQGRSMVDYNQLDLDKPNQESPAQLAIKRELAKKSGDLLGVVDVEKCTGATCCDTANGVIWDQAAGMCKAATTPDTFTVERLKYNQTSVLPNSASEVNLYSKL